MSKASSEQTEARTRELLRTRAWKVDQTPIDLGYQAVPGWGRLPQTWTLERVSGVAADSTGRVYVFHSGQETPPLLCFDTDGELLFSWSEVEFGRPHMVYCDADDNVWLVDDGAHVIYKLSPQGELLFTLGGKDIPRLDDTYFDRPTDIGLNAQGEMYVSEGYGHRRICKLDPQGKFLLDWGSEGQVSGEFALNPHALCLDDESRVYVADREHRRIHVFDPDGTFVAQWPHIGRPFDLTYTPEGTLFVCDGTNGRVTQVDLSGQVLAFFGEPGDGMGQLTTAHDIAYLANGDIVIGHLDGRLQKFSRR